jgi:hypothetical protein
MLSVFKHRVLRKIFGPKRDNVTWGGEDCITMSFVICSPHQILLGRSNEE